MKKASPTMVTYALSLVLGAMLSLGFPPFSSLAAAIISLSGFYIILNFQSQAKTSAYISFAFGYGFFLTSLYWISNSILIAGPKFYWLIPLALIVLPGILALYFAALGYVWHYMPKRNFIGPLIFATLWVISEIMRAVILTGLPWNITGLSLLYFPLLAQSASYIGVYGLSLFTVFFASLLGSHFLNPQKKKLWILSLMILSLTSFGFYRTQSHNLKPIQDLSIRMIQPHIPQEKFLSLTTRLSYIDEIARKFSGDNPLKSKQQLILLPEGILGIDPRYNHFKAIKDHLLQSLPPSSILVAGIDHQEIRPDRVYNYNAMWVINNLGDTLAIYDKNHLVPFGEFVPLQGVFSWVDILAQGQGSFARGTKRDPIDIGNLSFLPLICYESVYPEYTSATQNYDFIINITNDAWFGNTIGPYQHLAASQMRAIEQGKSLARVSNSGISAIINPLGYIQNQIDLGVEGVSDSSIDQALPRTFFSRISAWEWQISIYALLLLVLYALGRKHKGLAA